MCFLGRNGLSLKGKKNLVSLGVTGSAVLYRLYMNYEDCLWDDIGHGGPGTQMKLLSRTQNHQFFAWSLKSKL